MSDSKELILFVPGIGVNEPEEYLEKFTRGIERYCPEYRLRDQPLTNGQSRGTGSRLIEVRLPGGERKFIDILEVSWGDLRPQLSTKSMSKRLIGGLDLLLFWTTSKSLWVQAITHSKYMMFGMLFTLALMMCWYYGVLVAGLTVVGSNPGPFVKVGIPPSAFESLQSIGTILGSWWVLIGMAVIMAKFPVTQIIDISYATQQYLQNRQAMYHKVKSRISNALSNSIQSSQSYDRVTVVAHSFGAVVSTEVLATYTGQDVPNLRMITMGGPLLFINSRSERVKSAMDLVLDNQKVTEWIDFYSDDDWLCTRSPVEEDDSKFKSHRITSSVSLPDKFKGESHNLYFDDSDVIEAILK